jgi:hypothetical protein
MLKAGLVQACSTALTFGTKPLVEAAVLSIFAMTPLGATSLAATLTAALVGGAYVGVIHTSVSNVVSGLMNSWLSGQTYDVMPGSNKLMGEIGTVDLPVMVAFIGGYTFRGAFGVSEDILIDALSKGATSIVSGGLQGMITDALRQTLSAFEVVYKQKPARDLTGEQLDFIQKTFVDNINPLFKHPETGSREAPGHNIIGKTLGSVLGMGLTQLLANREMDTISSGAAGMTTYLTSWFLGIHVGSAVMEKVSSGGLPPIDDLIISTEEEDIESNTGTLGHPIVPLDESNEDPIIILEGSSTSEEYKYK